MTGALLGLGLYFFGGGGCGGLMGLMSARNHFKKHTQALGIP